MARRDQMDRFMVGGERGPSASNRPDPNAGRRPGDPYIIAQDSRPVGIEGLNKDEQRQYRDFLTASNPGFRGAKTPGMTDRQASKLGRMAFDQFRNLQSGGDYAPALRAGMTVPGGTIARRPQAERGLGSFLGGGGFLGGIMDAISGNAPKTIQASGPGGRGRGLGSKNRLNLNTGRSSAMNPNVGRDSNVLSRMITERPSADIPTGGIMDNVAPPADAPVSITTQPAGSISGEAPVQAMIFPETGGDTPFLGPIAEGTGDFSQKIAANDRDMFDIMMANAQVAQAASQAAADQTDLAEINMLQRGRELADGANLANTLISEAIADEQARQNSSRLISDAVRDEQSRQAALELPPTPGPMGISLDGYGRPIMDYMSPTEEAYMRMTEADDVGVYMDPSAQTSEQQLRPYDRGGVPGTGEGITMRPSDVLGAVSGMAPPSSYGAYREFNREGMPYVSRRALNTREDLGRMMDEMMNRRLGYAPNVSQGI